MTLDTDLEAYKLFSSENNFMNVVKDPKNIILELKYNKLQDEVVNDITNYFPFL